MNGSGEAIERLRQFQDEQANPKVVKFSHFLADRIGHETIAPSGYTMCVFYALYDLESGVNGFTHEPIEGPLIGLSQEDYNELARQAPSLARIAFSDEFGDEVQTDMLRTGIMPAPEASDTQTLDKGEIITEPIADIEQAHSLIVEDAQIRLIALDWERFGISADEVSKIFKTTYSITLRNAPVRMPINILNADTPEEQGLLDEFFPHQKKNIFSNYWLVATALEDIRPDWAMACRDHLFLMGMEIVATVKKMDVQEALKYFNRDTDGPASRAAFRLYNFGNENPSFSKSDKPWPF